MGRPFPRPGRKGGGGEAGRGGRSRSVPGGTLNRGARFPGSRDETVPVPIKFPDTEAARETDPSGRLPVTACRGEGAFGTRGGASGGVPDLPEIYRKIDSREAPIFRGQAGKRPGRGSLTNRP